MTAGESHIYTVADENALPLILREPFEGYQVHLGSAQFDLFPTGAAPEWLESNPLVVAQAYGRVGEYLDGAIGKQYCHRPANRTSARH